jgi:putative flippase GtrA
MDLEGKKSTEWLRFVLSATLSAIPNLSIFFLLMVILPETPAAIAFAMISGILAGYYCNYRLARLWVYRSTIT